MTRLDTQARLPNRNWVVITANVHGGISQLISGYVPVQQALFTNTSPTGGPTLYLWMYDDQFDPYEFAILSPGQSYTLQASPGSTFDLSKVYWNNSALLCAYQP